MTRQEAIKRLSLIMHSERIGWNPNTVEAFQMAIDALNDVPDRNVGDMISRQVALKEIEKWISALYENAHHESASDGKLILNAIKHLPSAQSELSHAQKSCEYCHEDSDGYIRPIEKNSHAWLVRRGRTMKLRVCFKGGYSECDILFCPMCGRRLTDG